MRSRSLCVALTLFCIFSLVERSQAGSPIPQESGDKQLRTLLETRRDTLRQVFELINAEMEIGYELKAELSTANLFLTEAELEIAESPAERVACFERGLKVDCEIEWIVEAYADIGTAKASDLLLAKADRLKTRIDLDKARIDLDDTEAKCVRLTIRARWYLHGCCRKSGYWNLSGAAWIEPLIRTHVRQRNPRKLVLANQVTNKLGAEESKVLATADTCRNIGDRYDV